MADNFKLQQRIISNTRVSRPFLVPEIELHLITEESPLWYANDQDLEKMGWSLPYWAFAWAGGQALARVILDTPSLVAGRSVLDFGAGCAIEGIAALQSGASMVTAADIDPTAIEAAKLNAKLNGLDLQLCGEDRIGSSRYPFDILCVGDATYDEALVTRLIPWFRSWANQGGEVWVADPRRGFFDADGFELWFEIMAPSDIDVGGTDLVSTPIYRLSSH